MQQKLKVIHKSNTQCKLKNLQLNFGVLKKSTNQNNYYFLDFRKKESQRIFERKTMRHYRQCY